MANNFDVLKAMSRANGKIQLAPLANIISVRKVKAGTQVTIGVAGDLVADFARGRFVGGLVLADREEFELTAKEIDGQVCPACGSELRESAGILSFCPCCDQLRVAGDDGRPREITPAELLNLQSAPGWPRLERAMRRSREIWEAERKPS
jgi:hypothetical protein